MKKISLILTFCLISIKILFASNPSFVTFSVCVDGYWNEWKTYHMMIDGSYSSILLGKPGVPPWDYSLKFTIDNYKTPSKKEIKYHLKEKIWYEYSGTVEYYVSDSYPTIESVFRTFEGPWIGPAGGVKRTARARIKIAPYQKHPVVYCLYFDNVGFALDLDVVKTPIKRPIYL